MSHFSVADDAGGDAGGGDGGDVLIRVNRHTRMKNVELLIDLGGRRDRSVLLWCHLAGHGADARVSYGFEERGRGRGRRRGGRA